MTTVPIIDADGNEQNIQLTVPGTAGTPSADVLSVQGVSGGTQIPVQLSDGTNDVSIETAGADGGANTDNRVPVSSRPEGYNPDGAWDRLRAGHTGVQTSAAGFANILPMAQYNETPPAPADGELVTLQADDAGSLKVNPGVYNAPPTTGTVVLTTTSDEILAANPNRTGVYFEVLSADTSGKATFYPDNTGPAVAGTGRVRDVGGTVEQGPGSNVSDTAWHAICDAGTVTIYYEEYS